MKALEILIDTRDSYNRLVKDGLTFYTEKVKLVNEAIAELEAQLKQRDKEIERLKEATSTSIEEIE